MRRDEHAAAEGTAVADGDGIAVELDGLARSIDDREPGGLPGDQRAEGGIGVDQVALHQSRLVGDAIGVRVEAAGRDAEEAAARWPRRRRSGARVRPQARPPRRRARRGCSGPAPDRCRARRGGSPSASPVPASAPPTWPTRPSPLITTGTSPIGRAACLRDAVLQALGTDDAVPNRAGGELALDLGEQLQRLPAAPSGG